MNREQEASEKVAKHFTKKDKKKPIKLSKDIAKHIKQNGY